MVSSTSRSLIQARRRCRPSGQVGQSASADHRNSMVTISHRWWAFRHNADECAPQGRQRTLVKCAAPPTPTNVRHRAHGAHSSNVQHRQHQRMCATELTAHARKMCSPAGAHEPVAAHEKRAAARHHAPRPMPAANRDGHRGVTRPGTTPPASPAHPTRHAGRAKRRDVVKHDNARQRPRRHPTAAHGNVRRTRRPRPCPRSPRHRG